jgi:hypothetical protein
VSCVACDGIAPGGVADAGTHGPKLQVAMFDRGDPPDEAAAAAFAAAARELLATKS